MVGTNPILYNNEDNYKLTAFSILLMILYMNMINVLLANQYQYCQTEHDNNTYGETILNYTSRVEG